MFSKKPDIQQKTIDFVSAYTVNEAKKVVQELLDSRPKNSNPDISIDDLKGELVGILLELFSTACAVININKAIDQSVFLKKHLHELGMDNYWNSMEPYNKVIADSATVGLDSITAKGRFKLSYITNNRFNMAKAYIDKYGKEKADEAVGRAINRFGVVPSKIGEGIALELSNRTGIEAPIIATQVPVWFKNAYDFTKK